MSNHNPQAANVMSEYSGEINKVKESKPDKKRRTQRIGGVGRPPTIARDLPIRLLDPDSP
jgi:hypothetical protein